MLLRYPSPAIFLVIFAIASSVNAHGFLHSYGKASGDKDGQVRGYAKINSSIDDLRSPGYPTGDYTVNDSLCRGEPAGTPIVIDYDQSQGKMLLTLAVSSAAYHEGACNVTIHDADDLDAAPVEIVSGEQCVVDNLPKPGECVRPYDNITEDMCLLEWSFDVSNWDQVKYTTRSSEMQIGMRGVLSWI
ncbi:unnamed protein product [Sphagnum troendelagicum]